ncbi:glutamyl-tRNA(Gln) amidotransferase subunit [Martiniozyma asiatica (nom. inval.)]|nr:glutamyl-tRNA(Gln) amidotransferase subunit [Martiniozyma asiatica]
MSKPALKIGLEIHTQLLTNNKLFSLSKNSTSNLSQRPNSAVSFFDVSLPGTQPTLNPECLLQGLKLATSLNCKINKISSFDRKHYFYGDQPLGYQITQHYRPFATNGSIKLLKRHYDKLSRDLTIRIQQLQLEQDTGRSIYKTTDGNISQIDFNRANIPLVELVTLPDFQNIEEVRAFLQFFTKLIKDLKICTGELETGSVRVDVNVSVEGHQRVEIKNLPTTSAIVNAIRYEENRQREILLNSKFNDKLINNSIETRGWDGKKTIHLRSKESAVDYRYVPDMELPLIKLNSDSIISNFNSILPKSFAESLDELMDSNNFSLSLRDAKVLLNNLEMLDFFKKCWELCGLPYKKKIINWLAHELVGSLTKSELHFNSNTIKVESFVDLIENVENGKITKGNGKLLLLHLVNNIPDQNRQILDLANEFGMLVETTDSKEIENIVKQVILDNDKVVKEIQDKKKVKKINFLIGQCMRATQGKIQPKEFEKYFIKLLHL